MKNILLVILLFISIFVLAVSDIDTSERVYDCGMAEWHPDIPKEVKDACRQLRIEEIRKNQETEKSKLYRT